MTTNETLVAATVKPLTIDVYSGKYLLGWHEANDIQEIRELYKDTDGKKFKYKVRK